ATRPREPAAGRRDDARPVGCPDPFRAAAAAPGYPYSGENWRTVKPQARIDGVAGVDDTPAAARPLPARPYHDVRSTEGEARTIWQQRQERAGWQHFRRSSASCSRRRTSSPWRRWAGTARRATRSFGSIWMATTC